MSSGKRTFRGNQFLHNNQGPGRNLPRGLKGNILLLMQTLLQKTHRNSLFRERQDRGAATKTKHELLIHAQILFFLMSVINIKNKPGHRKSQRFNLIRRLSGRGETMIEFRGHYA